MDVIFNNKIKVANKAYTVKLHENAQDVKSKYNFKKYQDRRIDKKFKGTYDQRRFVF
jgi:hypothetical protein